MNITVYICFSLIAAALLMQLSTVVSFAITDANDVKNMGVDEKLGDQIPSDIQLVDENGRTFQIDELLSKDSPTVLNLVYYSCPRVCNFATDGLLQVVSELDELNLGNDYRILTVSFDSEETPEIASSKAERYRGLVKNADIDQSSWQFLTGDEQNIQKLTQSVGFRFFKDGDEFAHGSALIIISPEGKVTRYLHGIEHEPSDFRLSLLEASRGEIGSSKIMNQVLLFCYGFDPIGKRYALKALNIVKASGVVTLLLLCGTLTYFWRRETKSPG